MASSLVLDPADATRLLVPVAWADSGAAGSPGRVTLRAERGDVEVWAEDASVAVRIGRVSHDLAPAIGAALRAGAIAPDTPVRHAGDGAALSLPAEVLILFRMFTGPGKPAFRPERIAAAMAGYRAAIPGEEEDPDAPADRDALLAGPRARLLAARPDLDPEGPELAELVDEAVTRQRAAVPDAACDAASASDKLGGLPYAEAGWSWPVCPCCGAETVFVAQTRDPMAPADLVQLFHCLDPSGAGCKDFALYAPERHALVRLFRMPDPARLTPIAPRDGALVLPGHRFDAPGRTAPGDACLSFGGAPTCLRNQHFADSGAHRVMEVWFPSTLSRRFDTDVIPVVRRGRGRVLAWADDG